jgi:Ni/Co efflux regulator RcnB
MRIQHLEAKQENHMSATHFLAAVLALSVVAASTAFAQTTPQQSGNRQSPPQEGKRLSYEQAWKRCAPFAQQESDHTPRYLRGAACMKHFGHNI